MCTSQQTRLLRYRGDDSHPPRFLMIGSKIKLAPVSGKKRAVRTRRRGPDSLAFGQRTSEIKVVLSRMSVCRSAGTQANVSLLRAEEAFCTPRSSLEVGVDVFAGRFDVPGTGTLVRWCSKGFESGPPVLTVIVTSRDARTDEREVGVRCADFVPDKVGVVCDRMEAVVAA